jgi:hypothetical protein
MILQLMQVVLRIPSVTDSLAFGLTNPTTVTLFGGSNSLGSLAYITGVMYQVCGILSVLSVFRSQALSSSLTNNIFLGVTPHTHDCIRWL